MAMGYKKDIFAGFAYEFELLRFLSEAQGFTLRDAMLSHRDVAHFVRSDVMFGATRQRRASRTAGLHHARSVHHLPERANIVEKPTSRNLSVFLVRATGLEPAHRKIPDPKSGASANSATPAFFKLYSKKDCATRLLQHQKIHRRRCCSIFSVLRQQLTCSLDLPPAAIAVATARSSHCGARLCRRRRGCLPIVDRCCSLLLAASPTGRARKRPHIRICYF